VRRLADTGVKMDRHRIVAHAASFLDAVDGQIGVEKVAFYVGQQRFQLGRDLLVVGADAVDRFECGCAQKLTR
jgi:hypothetical protein